MYGKNQPPPKSEKQKSCHVTARNAHSLRSDCGWNRSPGLLFRQEHASRQPWRPGRLHRQIPATCTVLGDYFVGVQQPVRIDRSLYPFHQVDFPFGAIEPQ